MRGKGTQVAVRMTVHASTMRKSDHASRQPASHAPPRPRGLRGLCPPHRERGSLRHARDGVRLGRTVRHARLASHRGRQDLLSRGDRCRSKVREPHLKPALLDGLRQHDRARRTGLRSAVFEGRATLVTDEIEKMHALWLIGARWAGSQPIAKRRAYIEGDMARCDVWRIDVDVISGKTREMRR